MFCLFIVNPGGLNSSGLTAMLYHRPDGISVSGYLEFPRNNSSHGAASICRIGMHGKQGAQIDDCALIVVPGAASRAIRQCSLFSLGQLDSGIAISQTTCVYPYSDDGHNKAA